MTYEEWSEDLDRLCCEEMFTDWTADRNAILQQRDFTQTSLDFQAERAKDAEADASYQRRHRKWALRRVRRWFYWRKRADDMGDAWLTQKSRADAAEIDALEVRDVLHVTEAERDKLAERVRVLKEAILRHQGANDFITMIDKDLYATLEEENR